MNLKDEDGAIIIEATLSLSFFMFFIVTVLTIVNICYVQSKMSIAINETAKEISQYSYLYGLTAVEDRINHFLKMMIDSRQHHFFVMTQEEEVLVSKHLTPEELEAFQKGQAAFYGELLSLWHIPEEKCTPKELGNLILSVVLIYNSAARSLPFFFPEELERTARAQATALSRYLASLADSSD